MDVMIRPSRLYKDHGGEDCVTMLKIVRFLHWKGVDIRPLEIHERNFPSSITILPTIIINGTHIEGLNNIATYYESVFNVSELITKSIGFDLNNPNYRCNK